MMYRLQTSMFAFIACCGTIKAQGVTHSHTMDEILRAWKARQDKATTARFEMKVERTLPKGSSTLLLQMSGFGPKEPASNLDPPQDIIVNGTSKVSMNGPKMRYSFDVPAWNRIKHKTYDEHYIDVFDGQLCKFLRNPNEPNTQDYPAAVISNGTRANAALQFSIVPIVWAIRGDDPNYYNLLNGFKPTGQAVSIGNTTCVELQMKRPNSDNREVFYLDSSRDYIVVRKVTIDGGVPTWQMDISYMPDRIVGWVPQSWEYIIRGATMNSIIEAERRFVSHYEIGNPIGNSEFDIELPAGTRVMDNTKQRSVQYVIQEGPKKGRIIPSDQSPTYQELQIPESRFNRSLVLIFWGGVFCLIIVFWLRIRWRRAKQ